ncbi:hypothetical protein [Catellatospora sp. NPDC049133]|jgi:hypothetical protein|uniref:hypothetical protein n=1 Tax=Catellatospora sp. NPDC049133 TaxID=3155499 RepID=UPI0033EA9AA3
MRTTRRTPTVGIHGRGLLALSAMALSTLAGCTPAESPTQPGPGTAEPIPWVEPSWKLRPGADDRVAAALLTADRVGDLPAAGEPKEFVIEPELCGHRVAAFHHLSSNAAAMWRDGETRVLQGVGSFNTTVADAAVAVTELRDKATCESFMARDGRHVLIKVPDLAPVAGVDAAHLLCEELRGDKSGRGDEVRGARCTALLAREDVISVLCTIAPTREKAESLTRVAADLSAATLVKAW